jgi:hypothetical protein
MDARSEGAAEVRAVKIRDEKGLGFAPSEETWTC